MAKLTILFSYILNSVKVATDNLGPSGIGRAQRPGSYR